MPDPRHEVISSIVFKTTRYPYKLNPDGTRNINRDFCKDDEFLFKFGLAELSLIIFRDSPNKLSIDNKELYFDYSPDGKFIGIHFEDEDYIWIVKDYNKILDECKKLYATQYVALDMMNRLVGQQSGRPKLVIDEYIEDELADEFDLEDEFGDLEDD